MPLNNSPFDKRMFFFSPHPVCLVPVVIICIELEKGSSNLLIYQIKMNINLNISRQLLLKKAFFNIIGKLSHLKETRIKNMHAVVI